MRRELLTELSMTDTCRPNRYVSLLSAALAASLTTLYARQDCKDLQAFQVFKVVREFLEPQVRQTNLIVLSLADNCRTHRYVSLFQASGISLTASYAQQDCKDLRVFQVFKVAREFLVPQVSWNDPNASPSTDHCRPYRYVSLSLCGTTSLTLLHALQDCKDQ